MGENKMNKVTFEPYVNRAVFELHENKAVCKLVRIQSNFSFVSPFQAVDDPKERE